MFQNRRRGGKGVCRRSRAAREAGRGNDNGTRLAKITMREGRASAGMDSGISLVRRCGSWLETRTDQVEVEGWLAV